MSCHTDFREILNSLEAQLFGLFGQKDVMQDGSLWQLNIDTLNIWFILEARYRRSTVLFISVTEACRRNSVHEIESAHFHRLRTLSVVCRAALLPFPGLVTVNMGWVKWNEGAFVLDFRRTWLSAKTTST